MHDYPDDANCFVEVVADSICLEITAHVIHAGIEDYFYDGCENYTDEGHDACCAYDKFWFNDEENHSCGCEGDNLEFGDGCNDHLLSSHYSNHLDYIYADMNNNDETGRGFHDRTFNSNSFKFNFVTDGSVAKGNLRIEWSCTKMASAPSDPIDRLDQLVQFSVEVIDNFLANINRVDDWKRKFTKSAERMKNSYQRCGEDPVVDAEPEWANYDHSTGIKAMGDVTTGFIKWANTYISGCGGHKREKHHVKRMTKWNQKFRPFH